MKAGFITKLGRKRGKEVGRKRTDNMTSEKSAKVLKNCDVSIDYE